MPKIYLRLLFDWQERLQVEAIKHKPFYAIKSFLRVFATNPQKTLKRLWRFLI